MFLFRTIIQVLAFVRKELFGTLRQPRLVLSLVLGPFLILALFGLGYQGSNKYNTILVVPNEPGISTKTADYKDLSRQTFEITEINKDQGDALAKLNRGDTDVVIVVPPNATDEIYNGKNAKFPVFYRNLNPLQANYIEYSTYVYASEFDKVLLRQALAASKPQTAQLNDLTNQLNTGTNDLDNAMKSGNVVEAKAQVQKLKAVTKLSRAGLSSLILPGAGTGDSNEQKLLGNQVTNSLFKNGVGSISGDLDNTDAKLDALDNGFNRGDANSPQQRGNIDSIRQSNASLGEKVNKISSIPAAVLVEPVLSDAKNLVSTPVSYTNFYAPAVVILLLQHIAITLASLSNVRDRLIGAMEIFRVAPIGPTHILTGKFLGYSLLLLSLGAILIALITVALGVPFINFQVNWVSALLVMFGTIYASIGLGYLVAGLSKTESQAVQLSMIILLGSIFFTGFVVPLSQFVSYVRYVGFLLPMTYGSWGLQNVMLDNREINSFYLYMPFVIGSVYLLIGRLLYRRAYNLG